MLKKLLPAENLERRKMGFGVTDCHWFRGQSSRTCEKPCYRRSPSAVVFQAGICKAMIQLHTSVRTRLCTSAMDPADVGIVGLQGVDSFRVD